MFSYTDAVRSAIASFKRTCGSNVTDIIRFIKSKYPNDNIRERYIRTVVLKRMKRNGELIESVGLYKLGKKKEKKRVVKANKPSFMVEKSSNFPYGKPNIPGIPELSAGDDATGAFYIRIEELFTNVPLAFMHAAHYEDLFKKMYANSGNEIYNLYATKFRWLEELSKLRNIRLAEKINIRLAELGKKNNRSYRPVSTSKKYADLLVSHGDFAEARALGLNIDMYFNETNDNAEVVGCTNDWCLDQKEESGKAADSIILLIDKDDILWTALIRRGFAPGIGNLAIAGGFLDKKLNGKMESYVEAAIRERGEEIKGLTFNEISPLIIELTEQHIIDWDPRPKFNGMIIAGVAEVYIFK
jgi:ribosomal protein S16